MTIRDLQLRSKQIMSDAAQSYVEQRMQLAAHLRTLSDAKLSRRLDLVRAQQRMAYDQHNDAALENLQSDEDAIIAERIRRFDAA